MSYSWVMAHRMSLSGDTKLDNDAFEGTEVLERMAEQGKVADFFDAIDSDDFAKVARLMKQAGIDPESITAVLRMMGEADSEH
jgi:hypothetical protein